jgi:hypothetical protein
MGFLVGPNIALDLRVLGFAPRVPVSLLERFFVIMKLAFVLNAFSGILLLAAYPTKALTNPLFYIKLLLIGAALGHTGWLRKNVVQASEITSSTIPLRGKVIAGSSLMLWAGAIGAGRLLAYTYTRLLSGDWI